MNMSQNQITLAKLLNLCCYFFSVIYFKLGFHLTFLRFHVSVHVQVRYITCFAMYMNISVILGICISVNSFNLSQCN